MQNQVMQNRAASIDTTHDLLSRYRQIRSFTAQLAAPLSAEDCCMQSMDDVSPTKWHLAHTTWFFETFVLQPFVSDYRLFHERYSYLFNSYYNAVGERHARQHRGLLSRPPLSDIATYRKHVDDAMAVALTSLPVPPLMLLHPILLLVQLVLPEMLGRDAVDAATVLRR